MHGCDVSILNLFRDFNSRKALPLSSPFFPGWGRGGVVWGTRVLYLLCFVLPSLTVLLVMWPSPSSSFIVGLGFFGPRKLNCVAIFPSPLHLRSHTTLACVLAPSAPQSLSIFSVFVGVSRVEAQKGI